MAGRILDGKATLGTEEKEVEKTWVEARSAQAQGEDGTEEGLELTMRLGAAKLPIRTRFLMREEE